MKIGVLCACMHGCTNQVGGTATVLAGVSTLNTAISDGILTEVAQATTRKLVIIGKTRTIIKTPAENGSSHRQL